jgi:hypothetical protein
MEDKRLEEFKTVPTTLLINWLSQADREGKQDIVNICAYELVCRIYVPGVSKPFRDLLHEFGYREHELRKEEQEDRVRIK